MTNIDITERMQQAIDLAAEGKTFFLTGEAGSGKSTLVRHIIKTVNKKNILQVAPTGIAAINIGGMTVHSVFGISPNQVPGVGRSLDDKKADVLRVVDLLVVDEVSMLRIDLLESMDKTLQYVRGNDFFMGGVQTIFVGDLLQLPPIIDDKLFHMIKDKKGYKSGYAFDYEGWEQSDVQTVILNKIFRQTDMQYISALNQIRKGEHTQGTLNFLNLKCDGKRFKPGSIILTPTNKLADMYNTRMINKLKNEDGAEYHEFRAENYGFNEKDFPAPMLLRLPVGSRVMVVVNDKHGMFVNGTMGTFRGMDSDEMMEVEKDNGETIYLERRERPKHVPIKNEHDEIEFAKVGQYKQYPVKYGRAITQHKSQGCTFDNVYIDLGPRTFATGQLYVALSRCKTLEGMAFSKPLQDRHVLTDSYVLNYLRKYD